MIRSKRRSILCVFIISIGAMFHGVETLRAGVQVVQHFQGSPSFSFDSDGSVGENHFAEISNLGLRIYDKANGDLVSGEPLGGAGGFWSSVFGTTTYAFDPRIQFDLDSHRWFAISATDAGSSNSAVLVGISETADPLGTWRGVRIPADQNGQFWSDYPIMGIDGSALYVSTALVPNSGSGSKDYQLFSIPKIDLIQETPSISRLSRNQFNTIISGGQPVRRVNWPQNDPAGFSNDGQLVWSPFSPGFSLSTNDLLSSTRYFDEVVGADDTGATLRGFTTDSLITDLGLAECCAPNLGSGARQPGTSEVLGRNRGEPLYRSGDNLYHVQNTRYLGASALHWEKIDATTDQILEQGFIGDPSYDLIDPSIAANEYGDVVISYTRSGPSEYASTYASIGQLNEMGELVFNKPVLINAGTEIYDDTAIEFSPGVARWSDYSSAVTIDPNDSHR